MEQQPAFVLHLRAFKNTSKIVEFITQDYGRITAIAKGVNRPKSMTAGVLQPFTPLLISCVGKSELKTLVNAEQTNNKIRLTGLGSYCGFYINELLLRLLPKELPHSLIFSIYQKTLVALTQQKIALPLRYFEYILLQDLGFGFNCRHDKDSHNIHPDKFYNFNDGFVLSNNTSGILGNCLLIFANNFDKIPNDCLKQLKKLMRTQINKALNDRPLKSRDLMQDYMRLQSTKTPKNSHE